MSGDRERNDPWQRQIHVQSCERMSQIPDAAIALTITSPPYWNAIDYAVHATPGEANYRRRAGETYADYLAFLERCFREVYRAHRPGTFCAVVLGTILLSGDHVPLPFHFLSRMEAIGWHFHQDFVWSKCTGGTKRFRSTIRNPYPGYFYPNIMSEYILLFRKPGERKIYEGRSAAEKERDRVAVDAVVTRDVANNVWHIAPVPPKQARRFDHPCPFPEEIPYRLVRWYSYRDDCILDPFCGTGTTLKVAQALGRTWVGYEIVPKYATFARDRVGESLALRTQLVVDYRRIAYGAPPAGEGDPPAGDSSGLGGSPGRD